MSFTSYKKRRDTQLFFESAGFSKSDISAASQAMETWVNATKNLLEAIEKVPHAFGTVGGMEHGKVSENPLEQELALEVQRARHVVEEAGLDDLVSRMNQYSARLAAACQRLND